MNSIIKNFTIGCVLFFCCLSVAQENLDNKKVRSDTIAANMRNFRPRLFSLSMETYKPIPAGDKFVGQGMEGKLSFDFKAQIFVYKQTFFKVGFGQTYLRVTDQGVTGNYDKTTITGQYLALGYEFLPVDKVRLGLSVGLVGNAEYLNKENKNGRNKVLQRDTAKLNIYELYIDYEALYFMALTFNYSYRNDKTNINVPQELQSSFDRAQFHTIGLGLKFYLGDNNIFH